jgi:hypothetical protein
MAHIGKAYRLAFRRDLSLQVSRNRNGWPAQMRPVVNNAFGSVASVVSSLPWLLDLAFDSSTGHVSGESQHLVAGGKLVFCRIEGYITGSPKHYNVQMQWFQSPANKLYERTIMSDIVSNYTSFGADRANGVTMQTPGVFQADPSSPAFDGFVAKFWH